ncbi:hypothetical protein [Kitasatospora sp. MBT63]|uniref:hypothetical protein n=1 Tax=Kitasatospora sp. MBT63 TaxID=1444768 RepID=UPI00053B1295|nr:hypothetical protein [Kitasatospora sp. MBT63]
MGAEGRRIPPLRAGRRPAGLALLGWLGDARAPRLCQVVGPPGSGRTHLLSWLADSGTGVHAVLPAAGTDPRSAAWLLGRLLELPARTPEELLAALAEDDRPTVICVPDLARALDPDRLVAGLLDPLLRSPQVRLVVEGGAEAVGGFTEVADPAVLDLALEQWTDRARFTAWCATAGADPARYPSPGAALGGPHEPAGPPPGPHPAELLADPRLLAHEDPVAVAAALGELPGTLPELWRATGAALVGERDPAVRAAVLRTRLIGLDGPAADRLAEPDAPWHCVWAMWPNSAFGWPGPVSSLALGAGSYAGQLLLADPGGTVRTVDAASGRPLARVPAPGPEPLRGLTVTPGGSVVLLDARGHGLVVPSAAEADSRPGEALAELQALAGGGPSAVAAVPGLPGALPALGDERGTLHWRDPDGRVSAAALHQGPVTALAGAFADGRPVLVSGGFDGAVRLWRPGSGDPAEVLERRAREVAAVAADATGEGLTVAAAWADGLVRLWRPGAPPLDLRLGSPVWALALAGELLVLGTADGIAAVRAGAAAP